MESISREIWNLPASFPKAGLHALLDEVGLNIPSVCEDYCGAAVRSWTLFINDEGALGVTARTSLQRASAKFRHLPIEMNGEISVGKMIDPEGVLTPIMSLLSLFHGDVGGTIYAYGHVLGMESLSVPPSSCIIWRRSLCGRLGRRAGDDGGCPPRRFPLGGKVGGAATCTLARVSACADELRLMGAERAEVSTLVGRVGRGRGSLSRKVSRACGPPAIERMWSGP